MGELVHLVAVHGRLSHFNCDGSLTFLFNQMFSLASTLTPSLGILWCSCAQCSPTAVSGFLRLRWSFILVATEHYRVPNTNFVRYSRMLDELSATQVRYILTIQHFEVFFTLWMYSMILVPRMLFYAVNPCTQTLSSSKPA